MIQLDWYRNRIFCVRQSKVRVIDGKNQSSANQSVHYDAIRPLFVQSIEAKKWILQIIRRILFHIFFFNEYHIKHSFCLWKSNKIQINTRNVGCDNCMQPIVRRICQPRIENDTDGKFAHETTGDRWTRWLVFVYLNFNWVCFDWSNIWEFFNSFDFVVLLILLFVLFVIIFLIKFSFEYYSENNILLFSFKAEHEQLSQIYTSTENTCRKLTKIVISYAALQQQLLFAIFFYSFYCIYTGNIDTATWPLVYNIRASININPFFDWYLTWFLQLNLSVGYSLSITTITSYFVSVCNYIMAICDHFRFLMQLIGERVHENEIEQNVQKQRINTGKVKKQLNQAIDLHVEILEWVKRKFSFNF